MRPIALAAAILVFMSSMAMQAQESAQAADHDALRKIKADVLNAINTRNLQGIDNIVHKPFVATVITQDSFTDTAALQNYYEELFTRNLLRMRVHVEAEADELSRSTPALPLPRNDDEAYSYRRPALRHARTLDRHRHQGRRRGKLLAIHDGTNFLDNPVLERSKEHRLCRGRRSAVAVLGFPSLPDPPPQAHMRSCRPPRPLYRHRAASSSARCVTSR